jgi:hypothetical protein
MTSVKRVPPDTASKIRNAIEHHIQKYGPSTMSELLIHCPSSIREYFLVVLDRLAKSGSLLVEKIKLPRNGLTKHYKLPMDSSGLDGIARYRVDLSGYQGATTRRIEERMVLSSHRKGDASGGMTASGGGLSGQN